MGERDRASTARTRHDRRQRQRDRPHALFESHTMFPHPYDLYFAGVVRNHLSRPSATYMQPWRSKRIGVWRAGDDEVRV